MMNPQSTGRFTLLIGHNGTVPILDCEAYGPFPTIVQAQAYAEQVRKEYGLPIEATSNNNEIWTDLGWTFAIKEMMY